MGKYDHLKGKFDNVSYIIMIKQRMKCLGIDLDGFIYAITNHWSKPAGFNFLSDPEQTKMLELKLLNPNDSFAVSHPLSNRLRGARAYREVSKGAGIHITLVPGKPYPEFQVPVKYHWNIHLDSVSACPKSNYSNVSGRQLCALGAGNVVEDVERIYKHIKTDLLHK